MFVVSYLDPDGNRYDASSHTNKQDAEKQLERFVQNGLLELQIEEKDTLVSKPLLTQGE